MKGKKILLWILIITAIAVVAYFIRKKIKEKKEGDSSTTTTTGGTTSSSSSSNYTNQDFPLYKGSGGDRVKSIQKVANLVSGNDSLLTVDGKWGSKTDAAVKKYLATDGSISMSDWNVLLSGYNNVVKQTTASSRNIALQMFKKDLPL